LGLGKVRQNLCVWYWFIFLTYLCPFLKKSDFVNNTTSDKSRALANKAETVQSDITLGRNYPSAGYTHMWFSVQF